MFNDMFKHIFFKINEKEN